MKTTITSPALTIIIIFATIISIPGITLAQTSTDITIPDETSRQANAYFEVISLITNALSKPNCEQIHQELEKLNTPTNQKKMDFDISALRGDISQIIRTQYIEQIQEYLTSSKNYLVVCKYHSLTRHTNPILNNLFKYSVDSVENRYAKYKLEEAERKAREEERKAREEAERKAREEAERKAREEARFQFEVMKLQIGLEEACIHSNNTLVCINDQLALGCGQVVKRDNPKLSIREQIYACMQCCQKYYSLTKNNYDETILSRCSEQCVKWYHNF